MTNPSEFPEGPQESDQCPPNLWRHGRLVGGEAPWCGGLKTEQDYRVLNFCGGSWGENGRLGGE